MYQVSSLWFGIPANYYCSNFWLMPVEKCVCAQILHKPFDNYCHGKAISVGNLYSLIWSATKLFVVSILLSFFHSSSLTLAGNYALLNNFKGVVTSFSCAEHLICIHLIHRSSAMPFITSPCWCSSFCADNASA